MMLRRRCLALAVSMLGTLLAVGCALNPDSPVVQFFFEVPKPAAPNEADSGFTVKSVSDHSNHASAPESAGAPSILHEPFAARQCAQCHNVDTDQRVRGDLLDVCRDCHPRYFSDEVGHPPVKKRQCLKCHEMHVSRVPGLLHRIVANTCPQCHLPSFALSPVYHTRPDVDRCTQCHDPHFGRGFRIKPDAPI